MKLQDQLCTREQGKELKELGIAPLSQFYHGLDDQIFELGSDDTPISAFSVAELGMMLPMGVQVDCKKFFLKQWQYYRNEDRMYALAYDVDGALFFDDRLDEKIFKSEFEAQARASALIYLLENNIITADEANKRLEG